MVFVEVQGKGRSDGPLQPLEVLRRKVGRHTDRHDTITDRGPTRVGRRERRRRRREKEEGPGKRVERRGEEEDLGRKSREKGNGKWEEGREE